MKRFWLIIGLLTLLSLAACSAAGLVAENPEYAIIMKSKDNQYNEEVAESFRQVTEEAGYRCEVLYPESARAQDQVILVRRMMRERVKAIAIAVSDEHALAPVLKEAMAKGIVVTTLDSDTEKDSRSIY
ncbi:MAG: substrate-binding domain-containing protein, partial [Hungatella sp.]